MKDIVKAIEVEKYYLECRMKNEYPFHLVDKIKECGFKDLSEFQEEKKDCLLPSLDFEVRINHPSACVEEGMYLLNNGVTGVLFMDTDEVTVYVNKSKPFNKEYCEQNNINVYYLPTNGGTIVSSAGDLAMDVAIPISLGIDLKYMLNKFKSILSKYETGVEIVNNDILINGGKVCGMTSIVNESIIVFVIHLSFADVSELIDTICYTDETNKKKPSFITKLNREVFKEEVKAWLQLQ